MRATGTNSQKHRAFFVLLYLSSVANLVLRAHYIVYTRVHICVYVAFRFETGGCTRVSTGNIWTAVSHVTRTLDLRRSSFRKRRAGIMRMMSPSAKFKTKNVLSQGQSVSAVRLCGGGWGAAGLKPKRRFFANLWRNAWHKSKMPCGALGIRCDC